ncbi:type II secretion system protein [Kyrpidia spormannii]|uniref:Uncharacterized protein n=1 Tax=Kyrpidia spormannii TaxID=2055160 RepID=A0ACA8ZFL3_9BACL|nr:hypothetical protein [Kyrpidia spormannii]CAB3395439.1 conserved protein of unknown function [Kyrpidia spormannii]
MPNHAQVSRIRGREGFTLVEITAAIVVALLVLSVMFAVRQYATTTERAIEIQGHLQQTVRNAETVILGFIRDSRDVSRTQDGRSLTATQGSGDRMTAAWDGVQTLTVTVIKATGSGTATYTFQPITQFQVSQAPGANGRVFTITMSAGQGKQTFTDTISVLPRIPPPGQ